jgi:hypothetical protein
VAFRNDLQGIIRNKFEAWQRQDIFDDQTSTGNINVPGPERYITLQLVDDQLVPQNTYKLWGVYCQSIAPIEGYDAQGAGALTTFNAVLAYQYWTHLPPVPLQVNVQVNI